MKIAKPKLTAKQQKQRDDLIFNEVTAVTTIPGQEGRYIGGCRHFKNMPFSVLTELVRLGFADLKEKQSAGPALQEIVGLAKATPETSKILLSGYAVDRERDDCRVTVDAILITGEVDSLTRRLWWDMLKKHSPDTDEQEKGVLFAWWD